METQVFAIKLFAAIASKNVMFSKSQKAVIKHNLCIKIKIELEIEGKE
jgi:hypothetical protein